MPLAGVQTVTRWHHHASTSQPDSILLIYVAKEATDRRQAALAPRWDKGVPAARRTDETHGSGRE